MMEVWSTMHEEFNSERMKENPVLLNGFTN
jgi:hypothetical protein